MDPSLSSASRILVACAVTLLALVLAPASASAAITSCSVVSAGIAFSPYNSQPPRPAVDGAGTFVVTCNGTGNTNALRLELTGGAGGGCTNRRMTMGAQILTYQVYQDAARTDVFCNGSGNRINANVSFATGPTQVLTFNMYGRVTAGQNRPYGAYSDLLTITVRNGNNASLDTTTATITGSVAAICTVSAGTLGFGNYIQTAASLSSASVTVNCSSTAPYQVSLGAGANLLGGTRRMAGPAGARLDYALYSDGARSVPWGDGTLLGARLGGTGSGGNQTLTVYGTIPAGQAPTPGGYSDSVLVTVEY